MLRLKHEPFVSHHGPGGWASAAMSKTSCSWACWAWCWAGAWATACSTSRRYYLSHPLEIFFMWQGGMSFHGGLLGVLLAMAWFARTRKRPWLQVMDFVAPCIPTGLAAGRVGNFINGELWGRLADPSLPWGMVFRGAGDLPRHPSQVYQFLLEGMLLFVLTWLYARKGRATGQVAAAFTFGYGVFRFIAEFFREPDAHLLWLQQSTGLSMGQWLCLPMIAIGAGVWWWAGQRAAARA
jgi:phosphatidylglycerol:prolipoprotein diacylglycerol transferase